MSHGHQDPETHRWEDDGEPPAPERRHVAYAGEGHDHTGHFDFPPPPHEAVAEFVVREQPPTAREVIRSDTSRFGR